MPDVFSNIAKVTRSYILTTNMPTRLEIPIKGQDTTTPVIVDHDATTTHTGGVVKFVVPQRKRGKPLGSMDTCQGRK